VAFPLGWVGRELGRRKGKDQPPAAGVDRGQVKHVAEERAICLGITGEDDHVDASDHGEFDARSVQPVKLIERVRSLCVCVPSSRHVAGAVGGSVLR
jgi:hypothetical protein